MTIGLDATYSVGADLTGVGVYSREILDGLAAAHPDQHFRHYFRPHRFKCVFERFNAKNCSRSVLFDAFGAPKSRLFHGLNQRLPRRRSPRMIATFHDLFVLTGDYSTAEFRARFALQAKNAAERSDLIISVSAFTASQVSDLLGVERSRIRVVPHGARALPEKTRENIILHVGSIQKRKNVARLVTAFERCRGNWQLVLAGGAGYGAAEIFQQITASPAADRITVTGYVTTQTLEDLYSRAGLLAFPSLDEGFGIPVLEAMAAGLPVVTSNRSALPEICGDAGILVDPESVDAIQAALERLMDDVSLRESLGRAGRQRAREFSWEAAVQKTWSVYAELL